MIACNKMSKDTMYSIVDFLESFLRAQKYNVKLDFKKMIVFHEMRKEKNYIIKCTQILKYTKRKRRFGKISKTVYK